MCNKSFDTCVGSGVLLVVEDFKRGDYLVTNLDLSVLAVHCQWDKYECPAAGVRWAYAWIQI